MQRLDVSRVLPEEIDSLGHLNVRFYLARVDRASQALLASLGVDQSNSPSPTARLRRIDTYCRFQREQFEGAELSVHGGLLPSEDETARGYFEIRNEAQGHIAATFVTATQLIDGTHRLPARFPFDTRAPNASQQVTIPDHGKPRSLDLELPRSNVTLAELMTRIEPSAEIGMTGRRSGVIEPEDCDADGFLRDELDIMFVLFRREASAADPKSFGPPVLRTDNGHRFGWAMLETRNREFARPRSGDEVVWLGADIGIAEKSRRSRRWAFIAATGELLSIHDAVGIAMDLDARRAIPIPPSIKSTLERHYLPEYA
ncbi:MAG: thioesterase family protein [Pseudomonadales bacterium]